MALRMAQNRKKLIELLIGNLSNSVVHGILERAANDKELSNRYNKELTVSLEIAKKYREKINPKNAALPDKDIEYVKNKITNKVKAELMSRIAKGYKDINLDLAEDLVERGLKNLNII
jgi:hypothetical protein